MNQVQPNCEGTEEAGKVEIESVINEKIENIDELHDPPALDYVAEHRIYIVWATYFGCLVAAPAHTCAQSTARRYIYTLCQESPPLAPTLT